METETRGETREWGGLEVALCMRRQVHSVITPINRINLAAHAGMTFISDTCLQQKRLYATRYLPRDRLNRNALGGCYLLSLSLLLLFILMIFAAVARRFSRSMLSGSTLGYSFCVSLNGNCEIIISFHRGVHWG